MPDRSAKPHAVEPRAMRNTMGGFATGVAIVMTKVAEELHGMTVNSLTSVSLEPPLLLVCFTRGSRTAEAVQQRGAFVVNLLNHRQEPLSDRFAKPSEDHFEGVQVELNELGLPVLPGGLGHLVCEVEDMHPGGDHVIAVARVLRCESRQGNPLIFYRGKYHTVSGPGRQAQLQWYW
ncbi:MAG: flavin reductase family protein [Actinomycetota bacterium]|nr:flavin reductase family protein [Actinomycetota bacterium]